jgi:drug/metabolite transporter (DMT)-like permease
MVPIVALLISAVFEGFRWHPLTGVGIAISVIGNIVILRSRHSLAPPTDSPAPAR